MILHATALEAGHGVDCDTCIVGAGAAGITLALELAGRGQAVCVLEAGGESYSAAAQRLMEGTVEADGYPDLHRTRLAALGGTTGVWAGWCRPLDAIDFEERAELGKAGWPFGLDDLLPCYRRAHEVIGLGAFEYDPDVWRARHGDEPLPVGTGALAHAIFHVRVQRMGEAYRERLRRARTVTVLLRAAVTGLDVDEAGAVRSVTAVDAGGRRLAVRARHYVLAAGGVENARLLLTWAGGPERAPGNAHGLVGRFFTDHPFLDAGWLVLHGGPRRLDFYFPRRVSAAGGQRIGGSGAPVVRAALTIRREILEREGLFGAALFFHPRYASHPAFASKDVRALLELADAARSRAVPVAALPVIRRALRRPQDAAVAALRRVLVRNGPATRWRVRMMFEAASRYENRVSLGAARDALGRPVAHVRWRLDDDDVDRMRRTLALFDDAFRRAGIGHVELAFADERDAWRAALEAGKHHMGTTRMHPDPARGVVDADCRVHGTRNLYVAGSSVFPSGGFANPTLTIVALALRLAEHLVGRGR